MVKIEGMSDIGIPLMVQFYRGYKKNIRNPTTIGKYVFAGLVLSITLRYMM